LRSIFCLALASLVLSADVHAARPKRLPKPTAAGLFRTGRRGPLIRLDEASRIFAFKPEFLRDHSPTYTHELPIETVKNQQSWGGCVTYSTIARLELKTGIPLAEQYNILTNVYQDAIELLRTDSTSLVGMGMTMELSAARLELNGALPASVWPAPRIDFESKAGNGEALLRFVNAQIVEFRLASAKARDSATRARLKRKYVSRIRSRVESFGPEIPVRFTVDGVEYTSPEDFFARALKPHYEVPESFRPRRRANFKGMDFKPYKFRNSTYEPLDKLVDRVRDSVIAGRPVVVAYSGGYPYQDVASGVMSLAAFHVPRNYREPDPAYLDSYGSSRFGGHVALVVGVDLDAQGRVIKFKMRNSGGDRWGERGFGHMYRDFFEHFVYNTWI
jgi:hypothetical protein